MANKVAWPHGLGIHLHGLGYEVLLSLCFYTMADCHELSMSCQLPGVSIWYSCSAAFYSSTFGATCHKHSMTPNQGGDLLTKSAKSKPSPSQD